MDFLAAILMAVLMRGGYEKDKELKNWMADLNVDYEKAKNRTIGIHLGFRF